MSRNQAPEQSDSQKKHSPVSVFDARQDQENNPLLLTCEHASNRFPDEWTLPALDRRLLDTHWSYDIGAQKLAHELATLAKTVAISAEFSRLLVDPNRPLSSDTLFRTDADGFVHINHALADAEREKRIASLYDPFHDAVSHWNAMVSPHTLCAVHTFTPVYEGVVRSVEVGILFDREAVLAEALIERIRSLGMNCAPNEPYSGKDGLMHVVDRHAKAHQRAIEIEVRHDLALRPDFRRELIEAVAPILIEQ